MSDTEQTFDDMMAALAWRPIAGYDRDTGDVALFRNEQDWALGYYGKPNAEFDAAAGPAFRHAQDWQAGNLLGFEPSEFATIDETWRWRLMED